MSRERTLACLILALLGPGAIAWAFRDAPLGTGLLALVVLTAIVLAVDRPSLGARPRWTTAVWALALLAMHVFVITPIMQGGLARLHASGFAPTIATFRTLPVAYRIAAIVLVPTIEEVLYRGYAIERLAPFVKGRVPAAILSSIVFALVHAPMWGLAVSAMFLLPALVTSFFYVWRRDLAALAIAHVATDALGMFVWRA